MTFSAGALHALLERHTPRPATGFLVAISGGADSAALLAALVEPGAASRCHRPVRAIHIDHGLQAAAKDFRRSAAALCERLLVPLRIVEVRVATAGVSVEAAAREARYRGLGAELGAGECLLTAHHADDQAETLLLQLLRGAGVAGLSAMPLCRPWASGWHLRPVLNVAAVELRDYAAAARLPSSIDPMNTDLRFDRAFLRQRLWPQILARWPGAAAVLARSARHHSDAQALLEAVADSALASLQDGGALAVKPLRLLSVSQQRNVLRRWLAASGVEPPPTVRLGEALRQILTADDDHLPAVSWGGHALRRYRDRLFLTAAKPPCIGASQPWSPAAAAELDLGSGLGTLSFTTRRGGIDLARLPATLTVRRRSGGETLRSQRRGRTHTLQHLCQSWGVLPWLRDALPLVYAGDELIAVGDLWQNVRWCVAEGTLGAQLEWRGAPILT